MSKVEATAQNAYQACEVGSYILAQRGKIEYISAEAQPLLRHSAVMVEARVFQLLLDPMNEPYLRDVTIEAKGEEV